MRRLWIKLALAFALLAAISVGLVSFIINQSITNEFVTYVQGGEVYHFRMAANTLASFYSRARSWDGVNVILAGLQQSPEDRLWLADSRGAIVADTANKTVGQDASTLTLGSQFPVVSGGRQVGTLYVLSPLGGPGRMGQGQGLGSGRGAGGGMGPGSGGGGSSPAPVEVLEERFLAAANRSVWITALAALAGAVVLSMLLARQITGPISALRRGVQGIAAGDFAGRVQIKSKDEVGDLAASFNTMAEALERNELVRRHMVADIAHELKTPLTVIEGTANALLDGVFPQTSENILIIRDQSRSLAKLVNDLRELSLAESGRLKLERKATNVGELVEQVSRASEATVRRHGLGLDTKVESSLPLVSLDPARVSQVLQNLLSNAIQHTAPGGKVGIEARLEGQQLLLSVSDTGEGIPAVDLPFIFDRFYRTDKSRARFSGGSGLGLAIVKQLVEAHGGRVWAESALGQGSRFCVSVPIDKS